MVEAKKAKNCIRFGYSFPRYLANSPNGTKDGILSGNRAEENVKRSPYGIKRATTG